MCRTVLTDFKRDIEMSNIEEMKSEDELDLRWKELSFRIEHYKYYLNIALQANVFYYLTAGGVIAFYLKSLEEGKERPVEYFLLLPILIGAVLGGVFIYGAELQEKAINNFDDVRDELFEKFGLRINRFHDTHLLQILLIIFGFIFYVVVVALIFVPLLTNHQSKIPIIFFYILGGVILLLGLLLPRIARCMNYIFRKRRIVKWQKNIDKWLRDLNEDFDISYPKIKDLYIKIYPYLSKETIKRINSTDRKGVKELVEKDIKKLKKKWKYKRKSLQSCWLGEKDNESAINGRSDKTDDED